MLRKSILSIAGFYIALLICCAVAKPLFMAFNPATYSGVGAGAWWSVIAAGLKMDRAVAGYFTIPLILIYMAGMFVADASKTNRWIKGWMIITSLVLSLTFVADTVLYSYWGFKLDTTPLFYLFTSPSAAMASASWWQIAGAAVIVALLTTGMYRFIRLLSPLMRQEAYAPSTKTELKRAGVLILLLALMFIPVRGGFTVSTMNLSASYFSNDSRLNHAAVNPFFSLLYSATHADDFKTGFAYFNDDDAEKIFRKISAPATKVQTDTLTPHLTADRPDIYLIILESFSSHLFPSLGGEEIAVRLDSIANSRNSILFTDIYASSFRTDRALTAILSGFPGQPTTSVMKHVSKAETLPSISAELAATGYTPEYFYGGDANFTNMKAYLTSSGFGRIISDVDFPVSDRMSKWGAHDDRLFEKVKENLTPYNPAEPKFRVIQTSSSHEPFEVPFSPAAPDEPKEVTAFRFTDTVVADFINTLSSDSARWNNSLVVIVPDHYGCYPKNLSEKDAHRIPLIFTGGALETPVPAETSTGSQTDIAATLLGLLNLPATDFEYSRNLLKTGNAPAFFSSRNNIALICGDNLIVYNLDSETPVTACGDTTRMTDGVKAYVQRIYRDIARR